MLIYRLLTLLGLYCFSSFLIAQTPTDTFLVKPYLQFGTKNSMFILWETNAPASSKVAYTKATLDAEEVNFDQEVKLDGNRLLHEVKIEGLEPATKYLYRVISRHENGQVLTSSITTFKTTVQDDDAYFFALVGDSQYNSRTPWAWGTIAEKVWQDRPNFILHAGDLVDIGTKKTDWTQHFFPHGHVIMSRYPMYTVLGNHEQDAQYYYDYMVNPDPEYYYTFNYGNAQFFMIDTNRDVSEGSEQYDWLEWALAQSTATWKFVVHHHPPYSSEENDHGDTYKGASSYGTHARNLVPLYEAYGVDFCLFGHTHVYERTWPILKNKINRKNGVIYINSGGAGGGLEDFDPVRSWFTQELQTGHHYCTFAVFENQLIFKAIDHEGRVFDTFQMEKEVNAKVGMVQPPAPQFEVSKQIFQDESKVVLTAIDTSFQIYYTLDGRTPSRQALRYAGPISVNQSCKLQAVCYTPEDRASRVVSRTLTKMDPRPAIDPGATQRGLQYRYYEGDWEFLPDFSKLTPLQTGVIPLADIDQIDHRDNHFGFVMEGYIEVDKTDTYTLYTYSDDGSKLYLDGELLVNSDGRHSAKYIYGTTVLEKGKHQLRIEYFEGSGNNFVYSGFVRENNERVPFKPFQLSH